MIHNTSRPGSDDGPYQQQLQKEAILQTLQARIIANTPIEGNRQHSLHRGLSIPPKRITDNTPVEEDR